MGRKNNKKNKNERKKQQVVAAAAAAAEVATAAAVFDDEAAVAEVAAAVAATENAAPAAAPNILTVSKTPTMATTMTADNDCHYFFLAGDVGGTHTRLALYNHTDTPNDNDDANKNRTFQIPLFMKEYLNEDYLATIVGTGTTNDDTEGCNNCDRNNRNNNNQNFVRKIILPFLDECCEEQQLLLFTTNNQIIICLGVAGPVDTTIQNGTVLTSQRHSYLTGLSGTGIVEELHGLNTIFLGSHYDVNCCIIINDFVAQGYGCLSLQLTSTEEGVNDGDDVCNLNDYSNNNKNKKECSTSKRGPILCVGAGTGFGSCYLTPSANMNTVTTITTKIPSTNNRGAFAHEEVTTTTTTSTSTSYVCYPSEVGQIEWVPNTTVTDELIIHTDDEYENTDTEQIRLWKYLAKRKGRVAVEDIVSGGGIATAYEYYSLQYNGRNPNREVRAEYVAAQSLKGKVVGDNYDNCHVCQQVIDTILMCVFWCTK